MPEYTIALLPAIGCCILLLLMPKMVLTFCKLRYMEVVNLVISHIHIYLILGIMCSSGVCLVVHLLMCSHTN